MSIPDNRLGQGGGFPSGSVEDLRRLAEEAVWTEEAKVAHKLRVKQIELEMQNEELRRTQEKLAVARARYFDIYNLAPAGYCTLNDQGLILEANLTAATMLGVEQNTLSSKQMFSFIFPEDQYIYDLHRNHLFKTGNSQLCELRMIRSDGVTVWVEIAASLAKDPDGKPDCLAIFENITERKQAENERKKMDEEIGQLKKMEAVRRLASGVAHDYNNILQIILGNTELLLLSAKPDASLTSHLREIETAGRRAADLTRQLLAFSRKELAAPQMLDTNLEIESMLNQFRNLLGKNIKLLWKPSVDPCLIKIDRSQLNRILTALIVNARDAIKGEGRIEIKTEQTEFDEIYSPDSPEFMPSPHVLLSVSDDGCGMDKKTLDRIFEPFFTTKPEYLGCGLGLACLHGLVRQNMGFIRADSRVGAGTIFKIYLPRQAVGQVTRPEQSQPNRPPEGIRTVLLVEDEVELLTFCEEQLRKLGYAVLAFANPIEALNAARSYQDDIHLLLADVSLPKMNGPELARRLTVLRPQMKCVFMSGYNSDILQCQKALSAENLNFLQKPFLIEDMANKIREVLSSEGDLAGVV